MGIVMIRHEEEDDDGAGDNAQDHEENDDDDDDDDDDHHEGLQLFILTMAMLRGPMAVGNRKSFQLVLPEWCSIDRGTRRVQLLLAGLRA